VRFGSKKSHTQRVLIWNVCVEGFLRRAQVSGCFPGLGYLQRKRSGEKGSDRRDGGVQELAQPVGRYSKSLCVSPRGNMVSQLIFRRSMKMLRSDRRSIPLTRSSLSLRESFFADASVSIPEARRHFSCLRLSPGVSEVKCSLHRAYPHHPYEAEAWRLHPYKYPVR